MMHEVKNHLRKMHRRGWVILSLVAMVVVGLTWRLVDLQVFNQKFLRDQGDARTLRTVPIPAHRGIINDRNGEPLAVSAPVSSIWVNPKVFSNIDENIKVLADYVELTPKEIKQRISNKANSEFVYLKRHLPPDVAQQIQALNMPGVFVEREYRRYYPTGEISAHVLGFTDIDGEGQEGLEAAFNNNLRGEPGSRRVMKDRIGRIIDEIKHIEDPKPGEDLFLSLDRRIQYLAYRELVSAVQQNQANSGSIVVMNIRTGEVLAMANYPSYNPNNRLDRNPEHLRNRAVTDILEPGSVMKTFSMLAGLESGSVFPETQVNTDPGTMLIDGKVVKDVNNYGVIDMTGVLRHSSNIGIAEFILASPFEQYVNLLQRFGFGVPTASGFPGERAGYINVPNNHDFHSQVTLAFGYGLAVTPLQLAQAYATLGNNGRYVPVTFLRQDAPTITGEQVISPELSRQINNMLTHVVHDDRGIHRAKITGYQVAGKSGTSRKATVEGGYAAKRYTSIFAGFAPATSPELVTVVVIDDPSAGAYYGGAVAAPVFSEVMSGALRLLDITPDNIEQLAMLQ